MNIGHNNPPGAIDFAIETTAELSKWLEDHPVVQTEEDARAGKLLVDRARGAEAEMERERVRQVRPFNEQVKEINSTYKGPKDSISVALGILRGRLTDYAKEERRRREAEAEAKRVALEEAEKRAREAEEAARIALEECAMGISVDAAKSAIDADRERFSADKLLREVARAERDADRVKIGGGFNRALGLREVETLTVTNWQTAIHTMGLSENLIEAILKDARAYRKTNKVLPLGVESHTEEKL